MGESQDMPDPARPKSEAGGGFSVIVPTLEIEANCLLVSDVDLC